MSLTNYVNITINASKDSHHHHIFAKIWFDDALEDYGWSKKVAQLLYTLWLNYHIDLLLVYNAILPKQDIKAVQDNRDDNLILIALYSSFWPMRSEQHLSYRKNRLLMFFQCQKTSQMVLATTATSCLLQQPQPYVNYNRKWALIVVDRVT